MIANVSDEQKKFIYDDMVVAAIRSKYSINDEFNLQSVGIANPQDANYVAYRAYVADCKTQVHTEIYGD